VLTAFFNLNVAVDFLFAPGGPQVPVSLDAVVPPGVFVSSRMIDATDTTVGLFGETAIPNRAVRRIPDGFFLAPSPPSWIIGRPICSPADRGGKSQMVATDFDAG
jgi:hypothetical protein